MQANFAPRKQITKYFNKIRGRKIGIKFIKQVALLVFQNYAAKTGNTQAFDAEDMPMMIEEFFHAIGKRVSRNKADIRSILQYFRVH